ncbi:carboxylesterase family protein [Konateibacter massiliensis]|uniref:carboxylesterase family protein n=1 Tax=Konateibacter massiliensis TaxID=2002841 RepID=UPI00117B10B1|nr:carboxylesterase family protein [Konateibacter massiliensis]
MSGCTQNKTQTSEVSESTVEQSTETSDSIAEETAEETAEDATLRETKFGPVQGYIDEENQTLEWMGVPYAKAPVGELRWKAPQDPDTWAEPFDASTGGNLGMQVSNGEVTGSEDCLNLDIYRPNTEETGLPVVVYIHGGNNQSGTSLEVSGETLANDANCIFISLNYRLGVFGFNCLPALKSDDTSEASGNYTLLDIAKSLDWVRENIGEFGGDAENVTVSGFSAGGRDVMALLISPLFEGKFDKAISFSGGMTLADTDASVKTIAKALAPLAVEDGMKATEEEAKAWLESEDTEVADYLYSLSAERLTKVMTNAGIRMSVFPHLYTDGTVIPKEGFEITAYNSVPLLMLTGTSEFSFFALGDSYFAEAYGDGSLFTDETKFAEYTFAKKYGSLLYELVNAQDSAQIMGDNYKAAIYTCAVPWGDDAEVVGDMANLGAFHGIFVPFIDTNNKTYQAMFPDQYASEGAQDLGKQFRACLANFLRSGDPNGEGLTEWEAWSKEEAGKTLVLDADKEKAKIEMQDRTISYDDVISQMEQNNTISEEAKTTIIQQVLNGRWFSGKLDEHFDNVSLWAE